MVNQFIFEKYKGYKRYLNCRFCFSKEIQPIIDLGNMPLAGGFLKKTSDFSKEQKIPLQISFCHNCYLVQSTNVIDRDMLFKDYFYYSSSIETLKKHFAKLAMEIKDYSKDIKKPFIVEIGCNDGVLLKNLSANNLNALGIDPASNIVDPLIKVGIPIINDYFSEKVAKEIMSTNGQADIITSSNAMAHIEDMHDILKGIKLLLKNEGILIFETHYIGSILKETQYDMIYHEHQYYYSLSTLIKFFNQYNMEVYDIKPLSTHGGSMRYYVQHKKNGRHKISNELNKLFNSEKKQQFDLIYPYLTLSKQIKNNKDTLIKLLEKLKKENKTIVGYGASGRGTIISNYCGLNKTYLDKVIDDAPAKQNTYMPGTHLQITNASILNDIRKRPDFVVLFAWSFYNEIKNKNEEYIKNGGQFIIPLPEVMII